MKVHKDVLRVMLFSILILILWVLVPGKAHADDRWHGGGWRGHGHGRYHYDPVVVFPGNYFTITIGGHRYFHREGQYYRRHHHGHFVEVINPYRVVIRTIPIGCRRVYIDGRTYYTDNVSYYEQVTGGYRLVTSPDSSMQDVVDNDVDDAGEVLPQQLATDPFTVNIPNNKGGGYTAIKLKRSGSGYVGPQGEYYADFPRVEQLRVMYGK